MGYLSSLVLFCLCCFASDVVELEPTFAIPTAITCGGITSASATAAVDCNALPGCTWLADAGAAGECHLDECWKYGDSTQTNTDPSYACTCSTTGLSVDPGSGSSVVCGTWSNPGYPPHGAGGGKDFYCQRSGKSALDECTYQYLKNGSCTAPYCILIDYPANAAGGKFCQKIPQCQVYKLGSNPANGIRLRDGDIAGCLTERYRLGELTACNQNPRYYLSGTTCTVDNDYAIATDQDAPSCTGSAVVKQVKGVSSGAVTTVSYCANPNNPVLNTCWNLVNQTAPSGDTSQCPVNPHSNSTKLTENTALCTGDCFTQTISSYYYGYTKICVNSESAGGGSKILVVPSLIAALLLLALFL